MIRRTSVLETFAFMMSYIADLIFDLRYGTNTAAWVSLKRLNIRSENLSRAVDYQPTQILPLRRLLKEMEIPRDKVFVDLGCGKGRVLLVAAEAVFEESREFSKMREFVHMGSDFSVFTSGRPAAYEATPPAVSDLSPEPRPERTPG